MDLKTIVESIFQMEEEMDLFSKKINDVHFWEIIRFNVIYQLLQRAGIYGQANTIFEQNPSNTIKYAINAFKNIFFKNPFMAPRCEILFYGSPRRKLMPDGLWWDIYSDPVIDSLQIDYQCLLMEPPIGGNHCIPAKTSNIIYLDFIRFYFRLIKKVNLFFPKPSYQEQSLLHEIENYILTKFNIQIYLKNIVLEKLQERNLSMPVYKLLLKRISPKLIIVICSYGKEVFIEVCKEMGITVIELQHGTISRYHAGYSFPNKNAFKKTFPDYFLSFGEFWKTSVNFPITNEKIINVGYPFFETEIAKYQKEEKKDQIIFISQGTIGKNMSKFAIDLQNRKDCPFKIVYKMHPGEYSRWKQEYPWLIDSGIRVIDDESIPLYKLLAQSKALVGVYSTVVYESLGFGIKIFLLDLPGVEYMEELIRSNLAEVAKSVDYIIHSMSMEKQSLLDKEYIFKNFPLKNITSAIDSISVKQKLTI